MRSIIALQIACGDAPSALLLIGICVHVRPWTLAASGWFSWHCTETSVTRCCVAVKGRCCRWLQAELCKHASMPRCTLLRMLSVLGSG